MLLNLLIEAIKTSFQLWNTGGDVLGTNTKTSLSVLLFLCICELWIFSFLPFSLLSSAQASSLRAGTHFNPFSWGTFVLAAQCYLFSFIHLVHAASGGRLCAADLRSAPVTVTSQLTGVAKYGLNRQKNSLKLGWEPAQHGSQVGRWRQRSGLWSLQAQCEAYKHIKTRITKTHCDTGDRPKLWQRHDEGRRISPRFCGQKVKHTVTAFLSDRGGCAVDKAEIIKVKSSQRCTKVTWSVFARLSTVLNLHTWSVIRN